MAQMQRYDALKSLVPALTNELVVCNLGAPSQEMYSIKDSDRFFYMLGSMGLASSIGLGLALGTKQHIVVIDGDGSVLMNLGTLATIAAQAPANLTLIIIDNGAYGSTGDQPTHTSGVTNLAAMARGAGIKSVFEVPGSQLRDTFVECKGRAGPHVIVAKVAPGGPQLPPVPLSPVVIIERFMRQVAA
jgi:sulfopyruvate decarboxylase subunit beta